MRAEKDENNLMDKSVPGKLSRLPWTVEMIFHLPASDLLALFYEILNSDHYSTYLADQSSVNYELL